MTVVVGHKNVGKDLQKMSKTLSFINQYESKEINFSPESKA